MAIRKRLWIIFLAGLAVVAMILLSAGITGLELKPGRPLVLSDDGAGRASLPVGPNDSPLSELLRAAWRVMALACVILLPFAILQFIISPDARRRIIRDAIRTLGFLFFYYLLAFGLSRQFGQAAAEAAQASNAATPEAPIAFTPPSEGVVYSVSLGLIAAAAVGAWLLWRRLRPKPNPLNALAREAQAALADLRAGSDLKNTVIRCYYEMSQTLNRERGIQRQRDMTPREFEQRLTAAGLPSPYVHRITQLFEEARYSPKPPGEHEEREAVECLTAIVQIFGQPA
jgi:hypothetical protein